MPVFFVTDVLESFADALGYIVDVLDNSAEGVGNNFPACLIAISIA